ncbi:MAG: methyltransferase [Oscillospiraceae bacterium]|nr:methyltransferase [Oscillospiraceae bacterium]
MTETERLWPDGPLFRQAEHMKLTTDALLLADFTGAGAKNGRGADLGCASGIVMLLMMQREQRIRMTGFELLPEAAGAARENLRLNGMEGRGSIVSGDLRETVRQFPTGSFDFVVFNPPYYRLGRGALPPEPGRALARSEIETGLEDFCRAVAYLCRSGGRVYCCSKPERLAELSAVLQQNRMEPKRLRFVHSRPDRGANLLLLEAGRDGQPGLAVEAPLFLTDGCGGESEEYRRICHR